MFNEQQLKQQFPKILYASITNDPAFGKTLSVTVDSTDLNEVEKISRELSNYLDTQNWFTDDFSLEVLSKGTDLKVTFDNIDQFIDKYLIISFKKPVENLDDMIAQLLEINENDILVKWNQKGRIRKIKIEKSNIADISEYIKF
ncbi:ribosome assembly cofactor RimP [Mycoplasma seminis]|uniref:Ribosome assembly cofactor RimP n=1 Tax=Mycoplasma seminis TaxID=512749 RepID=A0ABY9HAX0_9MOLU|nr:ribosome assembly cofactor RimP [Mycoplasma seminis]WLP85349.1 ribosome assembly cofactor RimP [Mycoplasma seminis]